MEPGGAWWSLVEPGEAWWSLVEPGGALWSLVEPGGAWWSGCGGASSRPDQLWCGGNQGPGCVSLVSAIMYGESLPPSRLLSQHGRHRRAGGAGGGGGAEGGGGRWGTSSRSQLKLRNLLATG